MNLTRWGQRLAPALVLCALMAAPPAHAVNRDMVQLQTQVQTLIDALARLQQSNDQQAGVLKDLVQQTVDSVNKMSVVVNGMQLKMQNQSDAQGARNDQISGQVQALNDSLDELKARMGRMEKTLNDLQSQAQTTNAALSNLPGAGGAAITPSSTRSAPGAAPAPAPSAGPGSPISDNAAPLAPADSSGAASAGAASANSAGPAAGSLYRAAYGDYMAGKYPLASSEFNDLIKAYPDDNLSGNAFFYLGEISNRTQKPSAAVKDYDQVLERYPDNAKIPAAHLHKGEALLSLKDTAGGERELRSLIQRFPNSPEAAQAKSKLTALNGSSRSRGRLD